MYHTAALIVSFPFNVTMSVNLNRTKYVLRPAYVSFSTNTTVTPMGQTYEGILPYSGGSLESAICMNPPRPADPAPSARPCMREKRLAPAVDAITCAADTVSGSWYAWSASTESKIEMNRGFGENVVGVGGRA